MHFRVSHDFAACRLQSVPFGRLQTVNVKVPVRVRWGILVFGSTTFGYLDLNLSL